MEQPNRMTVTIPVYVTINPQRYADLNGLSDLTHASVLAADAIVEALEDLPADQRIRWVPRITVADPLDVTGNAAVNSPLRRQVPAQPGHIDLRIDVTADLNLDRYTGATPSDAPYEFAESLGDLAADAGLRWVWSMSAGDPIENSLAAGVPAT